MRSAYRGRAAAYEKKGDYEKAVRDHDMVVLFFGVEVEILHEVTAPERDKIMLEASQAYRDRSTCQKIMGRSEAASADLKRALQLEQDARKLADKLAENGQIELDNRWSQPITVVIDGAAYRLAAGEKKLISKQAGPFRYELPFTGQVNDGKIEAGKTARLQIK